MNNSDISSRSSQTAAASRREFLARMTQAAIAVGAASLLRPLSAQAPNAMPARPITGAAAPAGVHIMSKMLQWLDYSGMAGTATEVGFDGIDLTVRRNGHVEPQRVEEDLPKAVEAVRKAGLRVDMMISDLTDANPVAERVLKTAAALGIKHYRMGYYIYDKTGPIMPQLDKIKPRLRDLVALSSQHGLVANYQNHSGAQYVGAPIWDFHYLIRDLDPRWVGSQFDIMHATVEGGRSWPTEVRLIADRITTIVLKDMTWGKKGSHWEDDCCPLGEGMVDFPAYMQMLKERNIQVPCSLHLEYDLGGADKGAKKLTVEPSVVIEAMRRDLRVARKLLAS